MGRLRSTKIFLSLLLVSCPPAGEGEISVEILDVAPLEVQREGGQTVIGWQATGADRVYYSVSVGLGRRLVASGRAEGWARQEVVVRSEDLDPCTNQVVLSVVAPGGAAGSDSDVVFLCPTPGCRGCGGVVPDGDADVDTDVDVDIDADADTDADECVPGSFPNGGVCDPVTERCCPTGTCEPDPIRGFEEVCDPGAGSASLGSYCDSSRRCSPGLTCFNYGCTGYCGPQGWDYDCPDGYRCFAFSVSVDGGPYVRCPTYGICQPY